MTNENNFGCGTILLALVACAFWILLILVIFSAFLIYDGSYWWLGLIFCIVTIVTHIIVNKKSQQAPPATTSYKPVQQTPSPSITSHPYLNPSGISNDYFDDVNAMVALLWCDYKSILELKGIDKQLDTIGISYNLDGKNITDSATKLKMLFWIDVTHCYYGLNNDIDLFSKSGFGLYDFIITTLGHPINSVEAINASKNLYILNVSSIVKSIRTYFDNSVISQNEFLVAKLLACYSDTRKTYLTHMFRFASIAAKADNEITEQEADWLANIVKMDAPNTTKFNGNEISPIEKEFSNTSSKRITSTSVMRELNNLIGLASVKKEVETLTNFIKVQQARSAKGMKTTAISYHCVFTGNPGTGKTTVARILAKIYKKLGVVSKGHLVETDRAGLVAEYVGQTAVKTNKIIDSALDGVLFIDEAYSLVQGGQSDYGKEAIATLLKRMEDDRERLVVIIAGYTKEMKDFIDANPGLQSRFNRYIEFMDYSADDLLQIFETQAEKCEYKITPEAVSALRTYFEDQISNKDKNFGNGRFARNVFEKTMERQANRLAREVNLTAEKLVEILPEDLPIQN